jgi:Sulfotransferase family
MAYYNLKLQHYFIHIPKNGGQAIANFLKNLPNEFAFVPMEHGHLMANEIEEELSNKFPGVSWTGFTTVRNPYTRYVSAYDFGFYTSKLMIEGRHRKAGNHVESIEQSWIEFGKLTPHTLLDEWIKFCEGSANVDFVKHLPYVIPGLKKQSDYVLPTTKTFHLESPKYLRNYLQNLLQCELDSVTRINATPLPYAKLQGLKPETKALVESYYNDDFILGKYPKEVVDS